MRSPLLWEFVLLPDGKLATSSKRLGLLGFDVSHLPPDAALVRLDDLPDVDYRYVEARQLVEIDAGSRAIVPVVLDAASVPTPIDPDKLVRNLGAVLNYGAYADVGPNSLAATAQYNLRLLTWHGVAETSGYANWVSGARKDFSHVRLDTNWRYIDVRRVAVLTIGDAIADPGSISSAYRFGGIQLRRDYGGRSDLVTNALPVLNGSAAVPSTVDLYLNGLRYFTGEVGRGPFQFRSLPNLGSGATATMVLTDATGRETRITRPIYFVQGLLPRGMLDFSMEVGFPRLNYGVKSFDYYPQIVGSGMIRYGVTDGLTLRLYAESMPGLVSATLGGTVRLGGFGAVTGAVAGSHFEGATGMRYLVEAQVRLGGIDFYGSVARADTNFQNIVTATSIKAGSRPHEPDPGTGPVIGPIDVPIQVAFSRRTQRFGASFTIAKTGVNIGYTHVHLPQRDVRIVNLALSRPLGRRIAVWANGYKDFSDRQDYGVVAGVSVTFGNHSWSSSNVSHNRGATMLSARYTHDAGQDHGNFGWSTVVNQGLSGDAPNLRAANLTYNAHHTILGAGIEQSGERITGHASVEGAVVAMDGLFFAPQIGNSFAVVKGASADTPVEVNTRPITHTDSHGRALVPELRSLATNTVSIDPRNLPIDMKAERTEVQVIPDDRAGVIVNFGVAPQAAAVLVLVDAAGQPLPVGSLATLEGRTEEAVVGYDGRTYVTELTAHNRLIVQRKDAPTCSVDFDFVPLPGKQVMIGPLSCR
ncbi:fimbrial biogenesis outer membrane usher protein [Altererythrobacter sp. CC-YST694]|uniref:fimbria/pilus outer membrane usher protein n=1 Tax=Altererythrobacter sp. CC-YST694 TaxID=2755038 RepID=UPI001D02DB32|nr:fimbria/pilus outer membrane usher protein [Altererythrobacter sp. CC-YST694]MCB5425947.1 fimbrial biogenesis outer membrane usher protein [Altererythrobacter sp. CC-YST694]